MTQKVRGKGAAASLVGQVCRALAHRRHRRPTIVRGRARGGPRPRRRCDRRAVTLVNDITLRGRFARMAFRHSARKSSWPSECHLDENHFVLDMAAHCAGS